MANSPLPALQHALQGKLLLYLSRPDAALPHLRAATRVLRVSHGEGHPLTRDVEGLLLQATAEAGAVDERAGVRALEE
jgi:hypothetical protein